jgi:hypothetical protein
MRESGSIRAGSAWHRQRCQAARFRFAARIVFRYAFGELFFDRLRHLVFLIAFGVWFF